jgi:hypothetical protein
MSNPIKPIIDFLKNVLKAGDYILFPINIALETVTRFNLSTVRRLIEVCAVTDMVDTNYKYPQSLEEPPFIGYLKGGKLPLIMLKLSIKRGNNSRRVTYSDTLTPSGDGYVGGYIYNKETGEVRINHCEKDLFGHPYNEY